YVNEPETQSVLLQRVIGRGPGNRRDDDLVPTLQGTIPFVAQGGDAYEVGRRAGVDHDGVRHPELGGERFLEAPYFFAHRVSIGLADASDGLELFGAPGRAREIVEHQRRRLRAAAAIRAASG